MAKELPPNVAIRKVIQTMRWYGWRHTVIGITHTVPDAYHIDLSDNGSARRHQVVVNKFTGRLAFSASAGLQP